MLVEDDLDLHVEGESADGAGEAAAGPGEDADGRHVSLPWMLSAATAAALMAIGEPEGRDGAPGRAEAQRRTAAGDLFCRARKAAGRGKKIAGRRCAGPAPAGRSPAIKARGGRGGDQKGNAVADLAL